MNTWLIPREELTREQVRAIELDPNENRVILGGPGSGKTQILLHRGQYLQEYFDVDPQRFRIFVYTNALCAYIQSALAMLNIPDDVVLTLDGWCMSYYRKRIGGRVPWNSQKKLPDFDAIRKAVLNKLHTDGKKLYDFVLVDEAQDLNAEAFQIIMSMAKHITVCADHKQQIYDHGSHISSILQWMGVRRGNVTLLETYRCCPYIVNLASYMIEDSTDRETYIRQVRTDQFERETPILIYARDSHDEKNQLIDIVRTRLGKGEQIAVLFPQQRQAFGYATAMREAGIEVENPKELDFSSDKPKLMPYHSAKGLTFDTVIIPRLIGPSFGKMSLTRINHILFVGITRARKWVSLITTTDHGQFEPLQRILPAVEGGCLTIREKGANIKIPKAEIDLPESSDDILDIL
jgi:superfamily I DNA/RNA helicase